MDLGVPDAAVGMGGGNARLAYRTDPTRGVGLGEGVQTVVVDGLERETGFEPATTCLEGRNSTAELLPLEIKHTDARWSRQYSRLRGDIFVPSRHRGRLHTVVREELLEGRVDLAGPL